MEETKFDKLCNNFSKKWQKIIGCVYDKFSSANETLWNSDRINSIIIAVVCVVSFLLMYAVNINTPLVADDFVYNYKFTDENEATLSMICTPFASGDDGEMFIGDELTSVSEIFTSMKNHYYTVNGRVVLHSIVQLMMLLGKPTFNVINSLIFVLEMLLIYKHCIGAKKRNNAVLFLAICLAVWTFTPSWGQDFAWLDGSINYLWGSVIRLAVFLPFRLYADTGKQRYGGLMVPLSIVACAVAGATNENSAAAMIGMSVLFIICYRVKKFKIPVWSVTGVLASLAGFAFMCFAPSNFGRINRWNVAGNSLAARLVNIPANTILYIGAFFAAFLMLCIILYNKGRQEKNYKIGISFIYMLGAVAGALVMIATPYFPSRAWIGVIVCAIISVGNLLYQLEITSSELRQIVTVGVLIWCVWGSMSYVHMIQDATEVMTLYDERVAYIEEQKELGNYDVCLDSIEAEDEHSPVYKLPDLSDDTDGWLNTSKARYYGLNSITKNKE